MDSGADAAETGQNLPRSPSSIIGLTTPQTQSDRELAPLVLSASGKLSMTDSGRVTSHSKPHDASLHGGGPAQAQAQRSGSGFSTADAFPSAMDRRTAVRIAPPRALLC